MILKELNGLPRYFALLRSFHGDVHINCLLVLGSLSPSPGLKILKEWMGSRFYIPYSYISPIQFAGSPWASSIER